MRLGLGILGLRQTRVRARARLRVLKPSPALGAPGHGHLLSLAYDRKTWTYPVSTVLGTVAFLLLLDTS